MSNSTINIIIIILSVSLTIITFTFDTKKNDKLTLFGIAALVFSILILGFSVYYALENEQENNDRFSANMKKFDTLIYKFDTSYKKADSILTNIDYSTSVQLEIQDTTKKIDSLITIQMIRQESEYQKLLIKHSKKLINTIDYISSLNDYLSFQLPNELDTISKWEKLSDLYFKVRILIASEYDNIILPFHPYLDSTWRKGNSTFKKMSWSFVGYTRPPIREVYISLYEELRRFTIITTNYVTISARNNLMRRPKKIFD